jgi:MarR family transcriptional regulator, lower aerobic nicotinate degradation pathway regulator
MLLVHQLIWLAGMPTNIDKTEPAGVEVAGAPVSSALLQLVRAHAALAVRMLAELRLVPPQELVVLYLAEHGPSEQRELIRYLGRDRSTVTVTLQAMERAGLIVREPSDRDRRSIVLRLTTRGDELAPRVARLWRKLERTTFGNLDPAATATLIGALQEARSRIVPLADAETGRPCRASRA